MGGGAAYAPRGLLGGGGQPAPQEAYSGGATYAQRGELRGGGNLRPTRRTQGGGGEAIGATRGVLRVEMAGLAPLHHLIFPKVVKQKKRVAFNYIFFTNIIIW